MAAPLETTITTLPSRSGVVTAALMKRKAAFRSVFHVSENDSQVCSASGPMVGWIPAASTTRSGLSSPIRRSAIAGSDASAWTVSTPPASARSACSPSLPRATAVTRTPSAISAWTVALPTPELAPVTTATFPRSDVIRSTLLTGRRSSGEKRCGLYRRCWFGSRPRSSAVAAREKESRADLEGFGTGDEEPEGIGQPIQRVEREADRERILDLGARDLGRQQGADVFRPHRVLTRELAQHAQRRPERLVDGSGLEIGEHRRDLPFIAICPHRDRGVRFRSILAGVDLRHERGHQLAIADRPLGGSAHRLVGDLLQQRAEEIRAVPHDLQDIGDGLAADCADECEQGLRPETVAAIEDREAHSAYPPRSRLRVPRPPCRTAVSPGRSRRTPRSRRSGSR